MLYFLKKLMSKFKKLVHSLNFNRIFLAVSIKNLLFSTKLIKHKFLLNWIYYINMVIEFKKKHLLSFIIKQVDKFDFCINC